MQLGVHQEEEFHWYASGAHLLYYHLLPDEQGEQIFAMTDVPAEKGAQDWRNHSAAVEGGLEG